MSWFGDWTIKYNGNNNDKFIKLAKLIIPEYENRFRENDENNVIDCIKKIPWLSADVDISKIMEYLDETDTIDVTIDGESHPIREIWEISEEEAELEENMYEEDGKYYAFNEYDYEEQTFRKENGQIVIDNEHPDVDRYSDDELGLYNCIDDLDMYINFITREIGPDDEMIPIIQSILSDVLATYDESDEFVMELRNKFSSVETTKDYFKEMYEKQKSLKEKQKAYEQGLPYFLINLRPDVISYLGGIDNLKELVEVFGEDAARNLLNYITPFPFAKRLKDKDMEPSELISTLIKSKSPLQKREDELSQLEQEEKSITQTEQLIGKYQEKSEMQKDE